MSLIIVFTNKSQLAPISDYAYQILVGDGTAQGSHRIAEGMIHDHIRDDGWVALVKRLLTDTAEHA